MKKLLIPISALFLAACGAANAPADAPTEVNSDTVLDDQLFQEATNANDLAKCDEIANSTKKDECKMVVQSFLTTAEAVAKLDASLCEDITEERYKENCEKGVTSKIEHEKAIKEIENKDKERLTIEIEATEKGDPKICESIEDENQMYSCKYNIIVNKAISQNDASLCDEIGKDSFIQNCKQSVSSGEN